MHCGEKADLPLFKAEAAATAISSGQLPPAVDSNLDESLHERSHAVDSNPDESLHERLTCCGQ